MTCLELTIEAHQGSNRRQILVEDYPFFIGRALQNDLPLSFPSVSGRHLVLDQRDDGPVTAVDLDSTNGTRIDGRPIPAEQPQPLELPIRLTLGDVRIRIRAVGDEAETAFTMAQSSTELRQMVDAAVRQSEADEGTRPFFEVLSGPGTGQRLFVDPGDESSTIGTSPDADLRLDVPELPGLLATITWSDDDCWLIPEPSSSIVLDNDKLTDRRRLRSGDRFVIDAIELLFFDPLARTLETIEPGVHQRQSDRDASSDTDSAPVDAVEETTPSDDEEEPDSTPRIDDDDDSPDSDSPASPPTPKPASRDKTSRTDAGFGTVEIGLLAMSILFLLATIALFTVFLIG